MDSEILLTVVKIIGIYLLADFAGGLFHWSEDTLGADDTPVWGPLFAAPNSLHHSQPSAMNRIHWLKNNAPLFALAAAVVLIAWALGKLTWEVWLFAILGGFNQQAHRFAHGVRLRLPRVILFLQRIHFLQDARHHWRHHTPPYTCSYCVLTPWLNPVLDILGFWRLMDRLFVPLIGAPRRPDLKDKPWYRDRPIWA